MEGGGGGGSVCEEILYVLLNASGHFIRYTSVFTTLKEEKEIILRCGDSTVFAEPFVVFQKLG